MFLEVERIKIQNTLTVQVGNKGYAECRYKEIERPKGYMVPTNVQLLNIMWI